jgi:hypothetical protein
MNQTSGHSRWMASGVFFVLVPGLGLASMAHAAVVDSFSCTMSWQSQNPQESFELTQNAQVVREPMDYARIRGHNIWVTESVIPIGLRLYGRDFAALLRFRHALDVGAVGRPMAAALWSCGQANLDSSGGSVAQECDDLQVMDNPFDDPRGRWKSTKIKAEQMEFPNGFSFKVELHATDPILPDQGVLLLECRHLATRYR